MGVVLDGHRRWVHAHGLPVSDDHQVGFGKIPEALGWCAELGIQVVTLWMLSDDNIAYRTASELQDLYLIDEDVISKLATDGRWRLHHIGHADLLPARLAAVLAKAPTNGNRARTCGP